MDTDNICRFVRTENSAEISILNFVYEKRAEFRHKFITPAAYSIGAVINGFGILHTLLGDHELRPGYLFFTFSAKPFYIEKLDTLQYIYISFIGKRSEGLLERVGASLSDPIVTNAPDICKRWEHDFYEANEENIDLVAEGLLLTTLAALCKNATENKAAKYENGILALKAYTDLNFTDERLDLNFVSKKFSYSPKYVSSAFSRLVNLPYSEYLRTLRLDHAKRLFESGALSVKETAYASGYSDALYFSKIFKDRFGMPPRSFIKQCSKLNEEI